MYNAKGNENIYRTDLILSLKGILYAEQVIKDVSNLVKDFKHTDIVARVTTKDNPITNISKKMYDKYISKY